MSGAARGGTRSRSVRAVRLATFNLFSGRSLDDGQVEASRLRAAIRRLGADVVGVQEADRDQPRSGGRDLTAEVADEMGVTHPDWRFAPALLGTPGGDWRPAVGAGEGQDPAVPAYGVGLVCRLPVLAWHVVPLPSAPLRSPILVPTAPAGRPRPVWLPDEPRVGLAAVVATPFGQMTVATTHLSFVPGWNLVQLRRLARALVLLPQPAVLLGDLNLPGGLPRLAARGWRSLAAAKTWPVGAPRVQFDHVLARGILPAVTGVCAPALPVSDHRALAVDLADAP